MNKAQIWEKNCAALCAKFPDQAHFVKDAFPFDENNLVEEDSISISSKIRASLKKPALLVYFGAGGMAGLKEYLSEPHKTLHEILIVERTNKNIARYISCCDISELISDKRVTFIIGLPESEAVGQIRRYFLQKHVACLLQYVETCMLAMVPDETKYYQGIEKALPESITFALQEMFWEPVDSYHGLVNVLKNHQRISRMPSAAGLAGVFKGTPGIVVSTGPSMQKMLKQLGNIADDVVIYSADSAFRILMGEGIKPHFVGVLERVPQLAEYFEGVSTDDGSILVTTPFVAPEVIDSFKGNKLCLIELNSIIRWFYNSDQNIYAGTNVASMGISLLGLMGCSPIYLVGQDLAYDRASGASHSDGMLFGFNREDEDVNDIMGTWMTGNDDRPILSLMAWRRFRNGIEDIVSKTGVRCINVIDESAGAKINGVERIDPATFTLPCRNPDLMALLKSRYAGLESVNTKPNITEKTVEALRKVSDASGLACSKISEGFAKDYVADLDLDSEIDKFKHSSGSFYEDVLSDFTQPAFFEVMQAETSILASGLSEREKIRLKSSLLYDCFCRARFWTHIIYRAIKRYGIE